jgi:tight adherence protein B
MNASPVLVISCFVAGMTLMTSASLMLLRVQARRDRLHLRIARTVGPHRRSAAAAPATPGVGLAAAAEGLGPGLARLFGFDPALPDHYLLRWWLALAATLAVSVVSAKVASGLTGNRVWLAVPVMWILLSRGFFGWCEARRRDRLFVQFPDALAMIVRAVRVGIPVIDSVRSVGRELAAPTGPEFARLTHEVAMGTVLEDALKVMAARNGLQEYRFFATALSLQAQTGGGLSETLETLADVIRKRVAVRQKGAALSSEAKTSALVLASLPPLAGIGLWFMNSAYINLLFVDPMGQKILAAAIMALVLGAVTMKIMINKSLS